MNNCVVKIMNKEDGMALIVSILTLLVLSLAGTFALNNAIMENIVAGNIRAYTDAFYKTEASAREIALGLKVTPDTMLAGSGHTIILPGDRQFPNVMDKLSISSGSPDDFLQSRLTIVNNAMNDVNATNPDYNHTKVKIIHAGAAPGSSLGIGSSHQSSSRHLFFIFSRTRPQGAVGRGVLLEVGYLRKIKS